MPSGHTATLQLYPSSETLLHLFSFQLWMESNNNHGVEERLRKQEGKKPTMPPYCRASCLKSQEQWEEEHLSWIKDGNIHWMEIFN